MTHFGTNAIPATFKNLPEGLSTGAVFRIDYFLKTPDGKVFGPEEVQRAERHLAHYQLREAIHSLLPRRKDVTLQEDMNFVNGAIYVQHTPAQVKQFLIQVEQAIAVDESMGDTPEARDLMAQMFRTNPGDENVWFRASRADAQVYELVLRASRIDVKTSREWGQPALAKYPNPEATQWDSSRLT